MKDFKEDLKETAARFLAAIVIVTVICSVCSVIVGLVVWAASLKDGSIGYSCRPDGTCKGDLVCHKEPQGFLCDLPKKEEKK